MPLRPAAIAVLVLTIIASRAAAETAPLEPATLYSQPGQLVTINHERRLNLVCSGAGSPTVVLISGAGGSAADWIKVQPPISQLTRVCAYDRAGYGFSDPANRESDAENAVDDLYQLLTRAGVAGPLVLVGHSIGGLYAHLFSAEHTDKIAGLVLVDPTGVDDFFFLPRALNAEEQAHERAAFETRPKQLGECVDLARAGRAPGPAGTPWCANSVTADPLRDRLLKAQRSTVGYWTAYRSEMLNTFPDSPLGADSVITRQIRAHPLSLGDRPLVLLKTPGRVPPGPSGVWLREVSLASARRLASASNVGRLVEVQSGHYIQLERPAIVIEAVAEVVRSARDRPLAP